MLNFENVLCLSPHPDDIEFSMAGTILRYSATKFTSVVFSTGSENDPVSNEARWEECNQFWKGVSNVTQVFVAPLLDTYSEEGWINVLEDKFRVNDFDALLLPPLLDTHYEHRFVHGIGMALTRKSPVSIIEYKSVSVLDTWIPNMIIKIGRTIAEEKINKMNKFESQRKFYFTSEYMQASHTHLSSLKKGVSTVEQFRVVTLYA